MLRAKWIAVGLVTVVGLGSLIGPKCSWPVEQEAFAGDTKVAALAALATASGNARRVKAIEDLRRTASADSFAALESLAASKDEHLAALALSAIARSGDSGAQASLEDVIEDTKRSAVARSFALTAWCKLRADTGADWDDVKSYVDEACGTDATMKDTAAAVKARHVATESR